MALRSRDITRSTPQTARPLTTAAAMASRPQQTAAFYTAREIRESRLVSVHHVTQPATNNSTLKTTEIYSIGAYPAAL